MIKKIPSIIPVILAVCGASLGIAHSTPIALVNADFEQGATGYTTDYTLDQVWLDAGEYWVGPSDLFGWSNGVGDHTTGSGNMAMYNGSTNAGDELWGQAVNLIAGHDYEFSVWVNLLNLGAPSLELFFGGVSAGIVTASNIEDVWQQVTFTFTSTIDGLVALSIVNNNLNPTGVDFALDDISLDYLGNGAAAVPIPGALPLFAGGLAAAGFFRRRRKSQATK